MRKQSCYFILPGLAQTCEVEIIESPAGISRRSVDQFRNKTVNVRIPLKASSESMESGNHTESVGIFEIAVQVVIVLVVSDSAGFAAFPFFRFENVFISDLHDGIAGGNKKKIQGISVFSEEEAVLFRNGKDNMSVPDIKAHGFSFDGKLFLIFGAAGGAESGMTVMVDDIEIATGRAFEHVIAEIFSFTEKSILYVVQDSIAKLSDVVEMLDPVKVVPENLLETRLVRIVIQFITVIIVS